MDGGAHDKPQVAGQGFLVAGGDATVLFDPADAPRHDVACPVQLPVVNEGERPVVSIWTGSVVPCAQGTRLRVGSAGNLRAAPHGPGDPDAAKGVSLGTRHSLVCGWSWIEPMQKGKTL